MAKTRKNFKTFADARAFVRGLNLPNTAAWWAYAKSGKRPADIPSNPNIVFKADGWAGLNDWIGLPPLKPGKRKFTEFTAAKLLVSRFGFKNRDEFRAAKRDGKLGDSIPKNPDEKFKGEWNGWSDFLGNK
jgi:hypothetical protein